MLEAIFEGMFEQLRVASALALLALGLSRPKRAAASNEPVSYTVTIKDYDFSPSTLEVPAGAKVTWINKDEEPHTATANKGAFASQPLDTDDQFTFEFKSEGTFDYFCTLHPHMTGKVVVKNSN